MIINKRSVKYWFSFLEDDIDSWQRCSKVQHHGDPPQCVPGQQGLQQEGGIRISYHHHYHTTTTITLARLKATRWSTSWRCSSSSPPASRPSWSSTWRRSRWSWSTFGLNKDLQREREDENLYKNYVDAARWGSNRGFLGKWTENNLEWELNQACHDVHRHIVMSLTIQVKLSCHCHNDEEGGTAIMSTWAGGGPSTSWRFRWGSSFPVMLSIVLWQKTFLNIY